MLRVTAGVSERNRHWCGHEWVEGPKVLLRENVGKTGLKWPIISLLQKSQYRRVRQSAWPLTKMLSRRETESAV